MGTFNRATTKIRESEIYSNVMKQQWLKISNQSMFNYT